MKVVIIKYNAGNIQSVKYALERLGVHPQITDDANEILTADKVIFPGVGEAKSAMNYLKERGLDVLIKKLSQPVLGICVGQQLLCEHSEEGDTECMGVFPIKVRRFPNGVKLNGESLKIPHMGWNSIQFNPDFPLFKNLEKDAYVYYVHSFCADLDEKYTVASTDYASKFSAAIHKDNFYALQFHPEKSGKVGEQILQNFLEL
jgi:imidazole glycerol-phosphate synthase subunit HisH